MNFLINELSSDLFDILKGFGKTIAMYDEEGKQVYEPRDGRRFYAMPDKMMLSVEPTGSDTEVHLYLSDGANIKDLNKLLQTLRTTATRFNALFNVRKYNKEIKPKDFAYKVKSGVSESNSDYTKLGGTMSTLPEINKLEDWFSNFDINMMFMKEALEEEVSKIESNPKQEGYFSTEYDISGGNKNLRVKYHFGNNEDGWGEPSFDIDEIVDVDTGEDMTHLLSEHDKENLAEIGWDLVNSKANESISEDQGVLGKKPTSKDLRTSVKDKIGAFQRQTGAASTHARKEVNKKLSDMVFKMNKGRRSKVKEDVLGMDLKSEVLELLKNGMTREEMASYFKEMGVPDLDIQNLLGVDPNNVSVTTPSPNTNTDNMNDMDSDLGVDDSDTEESVTEISMPRGYDQWRTENPNDYTDSRTENAISNVVNDFDLMDFLNSPYGGDFNWGQHVSPDMHKDDLRYDRKYIADSLSAYLEKVISNSYDLDINVPEEVTNELMDNSVIPFLTQNGYSITEGNSSGISSNKFLSGIVEKAMNESSLEKVLLSISPSTLRENGYNSYESLRNDLISRVSGYSSINESIIENNKNAQEFLSQVNLNGRRTPITVSANIDLAGSPRILSIFDSVGNDVSKIISGSERQRLHEEASSVLNIPEFTSKDLNDSFDALLGEDLELEDVLTPKDQFLMGSSDNSMEDDIGCDCETLDNKGMDLLGDILSDEPIDPLQAALYGTSSGEMSPISGRTASPDVNRPDPRAMQPKYMVGAPDSVENEYNTMDQMDLLRILAGMK